jgi:hypothetical protein
MLTAEFSKPARRRVRSRATRDGFSMDRATGFLRRLHPAATALNVQADTGIAESTVDNWLRDRSRMRADHLGTLIAVYGPDFLAAAFPAAAPWLQEGRARERIDKAFAELHAAIGSLDR